MPFDMASLRPEEQVASAIATTAGDGADGNGGIGGCGGGGGGEAVTTAKSQKCALWVAGAVFRQKDSGSIS